MYRYFLNPLVQENLNQVFHHFFGEYSSKVISNYSLHEYLSRLESDLQSMFDTLEQKWEQLFAYILELVHERDEESQRKAIYAIPEMWMLITRSHFVLNICTIGKGSSDRELYKDRPFGGELHEFIRTEMAKRLDFDVWLQEICTKTPYLFSWVEFALKYGNKLCLSATNIPSGNRHSGTDIQSSLTFKLPDGSPPMCFNVWTSAIEREKFCFPKVVICTRCKSCESCNSSESVLPADSGTD
jgi:hypothetical protein